MKLFARSKSTRRDIITLAVCAILIGAIFTPLQGAAAVHIDVDHGITVQAGGNTAVGLKVIAQYGAHVFPGVVTSETLPSAPGEIRITLDPTGDNKVVRFHFNGTLISDSTGGKITSLTFVGITHGVTPSTTVFGNGYYYGYGSGVFGGTPGIGTIGNGATVTGLSSNNPDHLDATGTYRINFDPSLLTTGLHDVVVDVLASSGATNYFTSGDVSFTNSAPVIAPTISVSTGTGTVQITLTTGTGTIANFNTVLESTLAPAVHATKPAGLTLPFGLFSFQVTGVPIGGTADVVLTFSQNLPAGTQYWKVIDGTWYNVTSLATISGNTITLHLTDGAADDADHAADGVITDPGGPVLPPAHASESPAHASESSTPSLSRPSFGGLDGEKFSDGLKINGKVFDISNYKNNIPQQSLPLNTTASISVKQQFQRGANTWQHVMIFMNFGTKDTKTGNADTWISIDKNEGVTVHDPNGFITNASAVNDFIDKYTMVTTFHFIPAKQMSDSNIIIRSWDDQHRQSDVVANGAISFGKADTSQPTSSPTGVISHDATHVSNPSYLMLVIKDWGGYSSNPISDSKLLYHMGIKGDHIPSWVMKLTKYVVNGDITEKEFASTIKYLSANGLIT